jgi:succinate dehydrogenase / fumarate reductase cytochrome b subunit
MDSPSNGAEKHLFPTDFIWRRLHSLMGFGLVVFLIFHLFVNSLAALPLGADGKGYIESVNNINNTALLTLVEIVFLGIPFFIHIVWGIKYLRTAKFNSYKTNGSKPSLPEFRGNRAYTWQRITSWLLIFGIIAHVIHMRFIERPEEISVGATTSYMTWVTEDKSLPSLTEKIGATLYNASELENAKKEEKPWLDAVLKQPMQSDELLAVANNFGVAEFLMMRDAFKNLGTNILYTLLVLAAVYHAFNGLWTFLICWGVTLTQEAQRLSRKICTYLGLLVGFCGLSAIWGTYWVRIWLI